MKTCKKCGCELVDGARFCKNCGSEIIPEEEKSDDASIIACPKCGQELEEGMKFCRNCGFEIAQGSADGKQTKFCSNCGFEMDIKTKFCPECGISTTGQPSPVGANAVINSQKSPVLAAILSFLIIGLGQVYLGLTKKGIILFILAIISGFLMLILVGFVLWLLVWVYAIYDGYNSANKMNEGIAVEDTLDFNNLF